MGTLKGVASSNLSLPPDTYIYSILPIGPPSTSPIQIAALCSDDSLRLVFPGLSPSTLKTYSNVNASVTCASRFSDDGNLIATAGRDGLVKVLDIRTGTVVALARMPKSLPISAIECNQSLNAIIAGTELEGNGPGDAPIHVWDVRKLAEPSLSLLESHTDTITELTLSPNAVHPTLLSASTDGLISTFDLRQGNEEDAIQQVINHRSAVHHAGFLNPTTIYGLGTDETLSFYPVEAGEGSTDDAPAIPPNPIGDVRERLQCDYVIDVLSAGSDFYVAAGSHTDQRVDIIPLQPPSSVDSNSLDWSCDLSTALRLPGGHGEEIVRDVFMDGASGTTFTCGEDGVVRAWRADGIGSGGVDVKYADEEDGGVSLGSMSSKEKRKAAKGKKERFQPY